MGLFNRKPALHTCFFCKELVPDDGLAKSAHYKTHLMEVTDNNGHRAFTFNCPRCGLMDEAWGGGRSNPENNAVSALYVHLATRHGMREMIG